MAWLIITMTVVFAMDGRSSVTEEEGLAERRLNNKLDFVVTEEEEIVGLDVKEHGLASAYTQVSV